MADTADNDTRRLAEIRARADAAMPGPWRANGDRVLAGDVLWGDAVLRAQNAEFVAHSRDDIPYLLALVAARDRELAELRGLLADLCEDSRAAAAAVRYRRALRCIAEGLTVDPVTGRLEPMTMDDARWFAKGQIEERR